MEKNNKSMGDVLKILVDGDIVLKHKFFAWPNKTRWTKDDFNYDELDDDFVNAIIDVKSPVFCNAFHRIYPEIPTKEICIRSLSEGAHWEISKEQIKEQTEVFSKQNPKNTGNPCSDTLNKNEDIYEYANCVDQLIDSGTSITPQARGNILHTLDKLMKKLPKNGTSSRVYNNMVIGVSDIDQRNKIIQINYEFEPEIVFESDLNYTTKDTQIMIDTSKTTDPEEGPIRVSVYATDTRYFYKDTRGVQINSVAVGVSLSEEEKFHRYIDLYFRPIQPEENLAKDEILVCAFFEPSDNGGEWSKKCCERIESSIKDMVSCRCYHLTHFGLLIAKKDMSFNTDVHYDVLTVITHIGCLLSTIGLVGVFLTAMVFPSWRSDLSNKVVLNVSGSVAAMIVAFFLSAHLRVNPKRAPVECTALGVVLHYALLSSFGWTLIMGLWAYHQLVTVLGSTPSRLLFKVSLLGWVTPAIFVGATLCLDVGAYTRDSECDATPSNFCYPSGTAFTLAVLVPVAVVLLINSILFALIVFKLFTGNLIKLTRDDVVLRLNRCLLLFFMFGLTWTFGLASDSIVAKYIFCALATMQGFVLFLFNIVLKDRSLWVGLIGRKARRARPI